MRLWALFLVFLFDCILLCEGSIEQVQIESRNEGSQTLANSKTNLLLVYSGPTSLENELYLSNFEYFLEHGLPSSSHPESCDQKDIRVVLVLTTSTLAHYQNDIMSLNATCGEILTVTRQDRCYDMESSRVVLLSSLRPKIHFDKYLFLNCGLKGPFQKPSLSNSSSFWANTFTSMINDDVKLSGITINCGGKCGVSHAHVQSMLWCTDRIGLEAILQAKAIYDCGNQLRSGMVGRSELIVHYELGLSRAVMKAGYAIQDLTGRPPWTWKTAEKAKCRDLFMQSNLVRLYPPDTLLFWKVSRPWQLKALERWQNKKEESHSWTIIMAVVVGVVLVLCACHKKPTTKTRKPLIRKDWIRKFILVLRRSRKVLRQTSIARTKLLVFISLVLGFVMVFLASNQFRSTKPCNLDGVK